MDWKWFCVILLLIGGFMLFNSMSKSELMEDLQTKGVKTQGTITSGEERTGRKGSKTYKVKILYQNPRGRIQDGRTGSR
ncbi:MAG: hypothetical protein QM811_02280 [Pirellulales bacterium]